MIIFKTIDYKGNDVSLVDFGGKKAIITNSYSFTNPTKQNSLNALQMAYKYTNKVMTEMIELLEQAQPCDLSNATPYQVTCIATAYRHLGLDVIDSVLPVFENCQADVETLATITNCFEYGIVSARLKQHAVDMAKQVENGTRSIARVIFKRNVFDEQDKPMIFDLLKNHASIDDIIFLLSDASFNFTPKSWHGDLSTVLREKTQQALKNNDVDKINILINEEYERENFSIVKLFHEEVRKYRDIFLQNHIVFAVVGD